MYTQQLLERDGAGEEKLRMCVHDHLCVCVSVCVRVCVLSYVYKSRCISLCVSDLYTTCRHWCVCVGDRERWRERECTQMKKSFTG